MDSGTYSYQFRVKEKKQQERIPVGWVPSAAVAVSPGWVCLSACTDTNPPWDQALPRSRSPHGTRHTPRPDTHPRDRHPPDQATPLGQAPPGPVKTPPRPPRGQTHACENITFASSLRTVKNKCETKWLRCELFGSVWTATVQTSRWHVVRLVCGECSTEVGHGVSLCVCVTCELNLFTLSTCRISPRCV